MIAGCEVRPKRTWLGRLLHWFAHRLRMNGVRLESVIERGTVTRHRLDGTSQTTDEALYVAHLVCAECGERTHYVTKPLSWARVEEEGE